MGPLRYKATVINPDWLKENNFKYSRAFSEPDDPVYIHRFPVFRWELVTTLEAEMRLHIKDGYVTVDVYDGSGVTRGVYSPFYYEADTVHRDFVDIIMKNIEKERKKLYLDEYVEEE